MTQLFDVAVTGHSLPGKDREQVIAALATMFSMDAVKAAYLLNGKQVVVKKSLDSANAQRYCQMLMQAGVAAELIPQAQPIAPMAGSDAAPETPAVHLATIPLAVAQKTTAEVKPPPIFKGFKFTIEGQPEYALVTVELPANATVKVEASAMATMDTNVSMKTKLRGGLGRLVTGESIFLNEFTAQGAPAQIGLAPAAPGDLRHVYLSNETIFLQNSAFLAAGMNVAVESKWQGLMKGFFSGENLFLIRCQGTGDLWFNSYGGIIEIDVTDNYVVDTGNIVAFTDGLTYEVTKVGGYKSLFFSGEGFVCRFKGQGKVWIQTRKAGAFIKWAWPFRPAKE
jgi:uncharacterized protein (TIGR00266 family)